ncbi:MAG: hypothetical protein H6970_02170 [Gammaproteobacteria bacterium]|nr:hypothetical protein [Gammaproteobacteria bacterium]
MVAAFTLSVNAQDVVDIANRPLFLGGSGTPLSMLVMGRDHKLYYEAYNDASDLNQDGELDVGYKPDLREYKFVYDEAGNGSYQYGDQLDYYGYFDSYKCYRYSGSLPSDVSGKFEPVGNTDVESTDADGNVTRNNKCTGAGLGDTWSGDFLNYLTTARIDAVRRVLYGGYRVVDTDSATVLERARVPQDAHSWGKEYLSIAHDGYDIREFTSLDLPTTDTRHLFANTSLLCPANNNDSACATFAGTGLPLLRVLSNSTFRVWEWLSIERPVAGYQCVKGVGGSRVNCAVGGGTVWEIVPSSAFQNLTQTTYTFRDPAYPYNDVDVGHPSNHSDFNTMVATYGTTARKFGSGPVADIDGSGNPFDPNNINDDYLNIFQGQIVIPTTGSYTFAVDGDDAVELIIDGTSVVGWYGGHGECNCQTHTGSITLSAGTHTIEFRHEEGYGGDTYHLYWRRTIPASTMNNYVVRVDACVDDPDFRLEPECKAYQLGDNDEDTKVYKPTGILHEYGETGRMAFGLISGSYKKNLSGGVLRKNMSSFANEINSDTGVFRKNDTSDTAYAAILAANGSIVDTIDKFQIVGFKGSYAYADGECTVPMVIPMKQGRCAMWGNPVAEMMYEGLRYFANAGPSSAFNVTSQPEYSGSGGVSDPTLSFANLSNKWKDPYRDPDDANDPGYSWCSKPFEIVIADAPSFDTDQLPGSAFSPTATSNVASLSGNVTGMSVASEAGSIWSGEYAGNKPSPAFIGESLANTPTYDTAPTPKTINSFGNIRGLAPDEPTREGGYYAASVAYHGKTVGVRTVDDADANGHIIRTDTFGVALSSPLPRIEIPVNYVVGNPPDTPDVITIVPFAKSVGGSGINAARGQFQPTNTIVDFYVEQIANTGQGNDDASINGGRPQVVFRINFEDSEYGSDHDMDAIVTYTLTVNSDKTLTVALSSDYEAGGILHHIGYVISGTTKDGLYLEVRDANGPSGSRNPSSDVDYFLDTPSTFTGVPPAPDSGTGTWQDSTTLPVVALRTFTAGESTANYIPVDPLWLAAKWGGFVDANNNHQLDGGDQVRGGEWDQDGDGKPDAYFLVTNAGALLEQLRSTFTEIAKRTTSAAAVAVNTGSLSVGSRVYQARFDSTDWSGELRALSVDPQTGEIQADNQGNPLEEWAAQDLLINQTGRQILTFNPSASGGDGAGTPFLWPAAACDDTTNLDAAQCAALNSVDGNGAQRLAFLRGDTSNEGSQGLKFRDRAAGKNPETVLGDIVNSNPFYVGPPASGYGFGDYRNSFAAVYNDRRPMIYIGANDGLLHGFDAETGQEVFAYVPSTVYDNLAKLSNIGYNDAHQYYVDGSATVRDVQFPGEQWHTLLVGSLRSGGLGYYALDVTDANSGLTEANAGNVALWEFRNVNLATPNNDNCTVTVDADGQPLNGYDETDKNFCRKDLGYSFSQPSLVRVADGDNDNDNNPWVVVFGNGYNNVGSGKAALFVLNVQDGSIRRKFPDPSKGDSIVTCLADDENGLSTPTVIDSDGDLIADAVYAGDIKGNLWKFDISDPNEDLWTCSKLFVAQDGTGKAQPITSAPEVVLHPLRNPGADPTDSADDLPTFMVLFGTGRYIGTTDITNTDTQTFYGVWDNRETSSTALTRDDLQAQIFCPGDPADPTCQITNADGDLVDSAGEFDTNSKTYRVTSNRSVTYDFDDTTTTDKRGWYLDLTKNAGERVVGDPLLIGARILFTSIQPKEDPCLFGGSSWLNILNPITGQRPKESFVSCCGQATDGALITETTTGFTPSSIEIVGIASAPNVMKATDVEAGSSHFNAYVSTSEGSVEHISIAGSELGRQSWRQLGLQ